jgi:uncharacterized delta-60 repeat protein
VLLVFAVFLGSPIRANTLVRDGQVDPSLNVSPIAVGSGAKIYCFAQLPDGKIIAGGGFSNISAGQTNNIARLNPDGSFDESFHGGANAAVRGVFPVDEGKILISGDFSQYDGVARNRIARINADGSLDPSYNPNFGTSFVEIVAVQPDGKAIVNGTFQSVNGVPRSGTARLNPDGSVDMNFNVGTGTDAASVEKGAVQPDGKILFVGNFSSYNGTPRAGVLRLNIDGSLDTGFVTEVSNYYSPFFDISLAANGKILLARADTIFRLNSDGSLDPSFNTHNASDADGGQIYSILAQPDGKVLIGGGFGRIHTDAGFFTGYGLLRFNADGSVDTTFTAQAGQTYSSGAVRALYLQNDYKALVGGDFPLLNGVYRGGIGRLNLDSSLDASFVGSLGSLTPITMFHMYPDGKMLVAGSFDSIGTSTNRFVARLKPDGTVDNAFSIDSRVDHPIYAIAAQPDGKIVLGGYTGDSGFGSTLGKGVWRINPNGSLDTGFDTQIERLEAVGTVVIQSDGKILIGGGFSAVNGVSRRALARLNSDGSLDTTFNPVVGGLSVSAIAVQDDGRILIGGNFSTINGSNIANIARLNQNGTVDTSFNVGSGTNGAVGSFLILPDGRIYVGGAFSSMSGVSRGSLVRLKKNGDLDLTFKPVRVSSGVNSIVSIPNGKVLIGGNTSSTIDAAPRQKIIRLLEDGSVDFSLDVSGVTFNGSQGTVYKLAVQADGKIVAAGQFDGLNGARRAGLARLLTFSNPTPPLFDFDGDGKTDIALFRPTGGVWYWVGSRFNTVRSFQWGSSGDAIVPADYDGDFRTDIAVFRPSTGNWYVYNSSDGSVWALTFGVSGDVPAPADFDGDHKADVAIYRPSTGSWWINLSSGGITSIQFGASGDKPVAADYDGDGKADFAVFRPNGGLGAEWWILRSTEGLFAATFGSSSDRAAPGDWTGDGKVDVAFFRPSVGTWFVLRSEDQSYFGFPFGIASDTPAPGDYDGDGRMDAAVFRSSAGAWYVNPSSSNPVALNFGLSSDVPVSSAFVR